ncbi:DUF4240 domain-containing protein [Streptomyces sp. NPDC005071]
MCGCGCAVGGFAASVSVRPEGRAVVEDRAWSEVSVELLASAVPWRTFRWFKDLIGGGCSDDSFIDFRAGLIALGRDRLQTSHRRGHPRASTRPAPRVRLSHEPRYEVTVWWLGDGCAAPYSDAGEEAEPEVDFVSWLED